MKALTPEALEALADRLLNAWHDRVDWSHVDEWRMAVSGMELSPEQAATLAHLMGICPLHEQDDEICEDDGETECLTGVNARRQ